MYIQRLSLLTDPQFFSSQRDQEVVHEPVLQEISLTLAASQDREAVEYKMLGRMDTICPATV